LLGMLRTRVRDLEGAPAASRRLEFVMDLFRSGAGEGKAAGGRIDRRNGRRAAPSRRALSKRGV